MLFRSIEEAVALADEVEAADGGSDGLMPGGTGVLIVGSVITAGDARTLLLPAGQPEGPGQPAQQLPAAGSSEAETPEPAEPESAEPDTPGDEPDRPWDEPETPWDEPDTPGDEPDTP